MVPCTRYCILSIYTFSYLCIISIFVKRRAREGERVRLPSVHACWHPCARLSVCPCVRPSMHACMGPCVHASMLFEVTQIASIELTTRESGVENIEKELSHIMYPFLTSLYRHHHHSHAYHYFIRVDDTLTICTT